MRGKLSESKGCFENRVAMDRDGFFSYFFVFHTVEFQWLHVSCTDCTYVCAACILPNKLQL